MKILAFDMAIRTGWAVLDTRDPYQSCRSGYITYANGKRPYELPQRLLMFRSDINKAIDDHGIEAIVFELAHHRGGPATRSALGMESVCIMESFARGVFCHGVHSATLKKFATGDGRADKLAMIRAAKAFVQRPVVDDNEADAINLARWGVANVEVAKNGRYQIKYTRVLTKSKPTTKGSK